MHNNPKTNKIKTNILSQNPRKYLFRKYFVLVEISFHNINWNCLFNIF